MLVWTRWGILALLIPMFLIFVIHAIIAPFRSLPPAPEPIKIDYEDPDLETRIKQKKAQIEAERQLVINNQKRSEQTDNTAFLIGGLLSAVILWPLGRKMNRYEIRRLIDPSTGDTYVTQIGGGHTCFFIPMEYWSFLWVFISVVKSLT